MMLRVTFQSMGLKGIVWYGVCAEGGQPGAVQPVEQLGHGSKISLARRSLFRRETGCLDVVCVEQAIFDSWALARLPFGEQTDRFTE